MDESPILSARKYFRKPACCAGPPSEARVFAVTVVLRPVPLIAGRQSHIGDSTGKVVKGFYLAGPRIESDFFSSCWKPWPRFEPGSLCLGQYRSKRNSVGFYRTSQDHLNPNQNVKAKDDEELKDLPDRGL